VNILRVLSTCFLWWIFSIWQYYFSKKKTFVLVLIFSTTFSPFIVLTTNVLWHLCSMIKQIQWSECEMQWNMPFIPITPKFKKNSIGISNKLHELEINSYFNFENCCYETKNIFLFQYESSYLNSENYYMNLIIL
jgi:hypothetical protein